MIDLSKLAEHPAIESRWPLKARKPSQASRISVVLRGKLPRSPHALCDLLDSEAVRQAEAMGLAIVACATVAHDVAEGEAIALARDYWAAPKVEKTCSTGRKSTPTGGGRRKTSKSST